MTKPTDWLAFSARVRAAFGAGDPELIASLIDPEMTVWENADEIVRSAAATREFHHELMQVSNHSNLKSGR